MLSNRNKAFCIHRLLLSTLRLAAKQPQERRSTMLFLGIFNYDPADRNLVIERRVKGTDKDVGVTIKGEWFDLSGHRIFRLFEADDDVHLASSVYNWSDLGIAEVIPVMETDKALKFLKRTKKAG
jgi:hypothetical protein